MESTTVNGQAATTAEGGQQPTAQAGTPNTAGVQAQDTSAPFKAFATQQEFDNEAAKIRGAAERKATEALLKSLGLQPGDEAKLADIKKAYDSSLTEAERQQGEITALREANTAQTAQLEEAQYFLAALTKMSGKTSDDVSKLVRMARGLKDADTTIEQAIDQVLAMVSSPTDDTPAAPPAMPKGTALLQPDPKEPEPMDLLSALNQKYNRGG